MCAATCFCNPRTRTQHSEHPRKKWRRSPPPGSPAGAVALRSSRVSTYELVGTNGGLRSAGFGGQFWLAHTSGQEEVVVRAGKDLDRGPEAAGAACRHLSSRNLTVDTSAAGVEGCRQLQREGRGESSSPTPSHGGRAFRCAGPFADCGTKRRATPSSLRPPPNLSPALNPQSQQQRRRRAGASRPPPAAAAAAAPASSTARRRRRRPAAGPSRRAASRRSTRCCSTTTTSTAATTW